MADITRLPKPLIVHWEWQVRAACRGMDTVTFFHPPNERDAAREARIAQAKAICRGCPAINECLDHALRAREPYGVWGGLSEDERASLLGLESLRYPKPLGTTPTGDPRSEHTTVAAR
jgi:WhiB family redox-sensing transcriptional regulator